MHDGLLLCLLPLLLQLPLLLLLDILIGMMLVARSVMLLLEQSARLTHLPKEVQAERGYSGRLEYRTIVIVVGTLCQATSARRWQRGEGHERRLYQGPGELAVIVDHAAE